MPRLTWCLATVQFAECAADSSEPGQHGRCCSRAWCAATQPGALHGSLLGGSPYATGRNQHLVASTCCYRHYVVHGLPERYLLYFGSI